MRGGDAGVVRVAVPETSRRYIGYNINMKLRLSIALFLLGLALLLTRAQSLADQEGPDSLKPGTHARNLQQGSAKRNYRLHVPAGFSGEKPVPLVICLHGMGANGQIMEVLTGFSKLADKKGFAVAYPDGLARMWRFWDKEDVQFIDALIGELVKQKLADPKRVYVTGISNGAYFANRLGYDLGDKIAAIAPVSGTFIKAAADKAPKPKSPMPVLYIHGTEDRITGYDGKDLFTKKNASLAAEQLVAWWAKHNDCGNKPKVQELPDKAEDGTKVERWLYRPEKDGAVVEFYKVIGGGHTWPDGSFQPEFLLGRTCRDFNASAVIWEFFSRHQRKKQMNHRVYRFALAASLGCITPSVCPSRLSCG